MAERKGCHGGEKEMVPRQHIRKWCHGNISVPVAHGDTGAKGGVRMRAWMVGWSRIPGVPHNGGRPSPASYSVPRRRLGVRARSRSGSGIFRLTSLPRNPNFRAIFDCLYLRNRSSVLGVWYIKIFASTCTSFHSIASFAFEVILLPKMLLEGGFVS